MLHKLAMSSVLLKAGLVLSAVAPVLAILIVIAWHLFLQPERKSDHDYD